MTQGASSPASPASPASSASFASIGQRFGAYLVDALIGAGLYLVILLIAYATPSPALLSIGSVIVLGYAVYVLSLIATKGYTPGKKVVGIRVVDADTQQPIGWARALGRSVILGLLGSFCALPLLIAAAVANGHPRRQAWHDLAVRSVVVQESALGADTPSVAPAPAEGVLPVGLPPTSARAPQSGPVSSSPPQGPSGGAPPPPPFPGVAPSAPHPPVPPGMAPAPSGPVVPPPPGMISPPPSMAPPPPPAPTGATHSPVDESTRLAARRTPSVISWSLAPAIGVPLQLSGTVVLGRDPDAALVPDASAWLVDDPERTVSKTHAVAGVKNGVAWIEDWSSTNGVVVVRGDQEIEVATGEPTTLQPADVVMLGDFELTVRQGA